MDKKQNNKAILDMDMKDEQILFEDAKYRCLEYHQKQTEDLYLMMCGVEDGGFFEVDDREGYHLHIVLSGKGVLHTEKHGTKEIRFGQMFVTKPGEWCKYDPNPQDPWKYCWVAFDGKKAKDYMDNMGLGDGVYVNDCHVEPYKFYELAKRVLDHPELTLARDLFRLGILFEFLGLAVESYYKSGQTSRRQSDYSPEVYADYALDLIHYNYRTIKVSDIAKYIGINRSYLSNIFKEKMGISPQEYLIQYRMGEAARLLKETNQPIQDIAHKVGYSDPLTFSKMFKGTYGTSPRYYRIQYEDLSQEK